ncbi:hypothetical protein [Wolbachia endosymbiont of Folsomia candida]|uniref:hypothetical protein n=1 Tax=Wolbachia endosymbiont of Folsomia candida TaxID=169402 RepID=UPI000A545D56|nr:hypothetical protein [Wolbachia endosymbiont of Folsomia candida]
MSLQKIIIDQLEKKLDQPFLHKLATDKKYFEEISKYLKHNLNISLEKFIRSVYRSSGGDINLRDHKGETALYPASENFNQGMVRILKSCGMNISDFNREVSNKIWENCKKSRRISLINEANISNICDAIRSTTSAENVLQHLVSATVGLIVNTTTTMIINAINGDYYNNSIIPIIHRSSTDFIANRVNNIIGFTFGTMAHKFAQITPELVRNISDLLHNRLEERSNDLEIARYEKIQENVASILTEVQVERILSKDRHR